MVSTAMILGGWVWGIRQRVLNRPEYRRALREAELEEKPWLVPLKGSNESENRAERIWEDVMPEFAIRDYFHGLQHRYPSLIPGVFDSSFSQQQDVDLEAPAEAHIHTKDRRHTTREERLRTWSASKSRQSKFLERFLLLPVEIRILIMEHLAFGDVERLRRTCRDFRMSISKPMIKLAFPYLSETLASTCRHCLGTDASSRLIIKTVYNHPEGAFKNQCWRCVSRRKEYKLDKRYEMVDETKCYFCRWCGYPVPRGTGAGHRVERMQYHNACSRKRTKANRWFFTAGFLQWGMLLTACGMCWAHFPEYGLVTGFTIVSEAISTLPGFFTDSMQDGVLLVSLGLFVDLCSKTEAAHVSLGFDLEAVYIGVLDSSCLHDQLACPELGRQTV
jgi:hypothetical protein